MLLLLPELRGFSWKFNPRLWREMIAYSAPLLVLGIAGIMNSTLYSILFPELYPDKAEAMSQLGIYGANIKIAIVMVMFIQAFRFAYEPFIFAKAKDRGDDRMQSYRDAMKYFVIFAMVIFLGVMFYLDILRLFIAESYFSGLKVVPIVMIAEFFFGIFFNLSLWYKLTDKTVSGHVVLAARTGCHCGAKRTARASLRLYGLRPGIICLLWHHDAGELFGRTCQISDRLPWFRA